MVVFGVVRDNLNEKMKKIDKKVIQIEIDKNKPVAVY